MFQTDPLPADDFQAEIAFLGMESSPAFVREPEGNDRAERFIRTLKKNLLWVRHFGTIEEPSQALLEFRRSYNTTWLVERHGFRAPAAVRAAPTSPPAYQRATVRQLFGNNMRYIHVLFSSIFYIKVRGNILIYS
jgi:hypothetical protein